MTQFLGPRFVLSVMTNRTTCGLRPSELPQSRLDDLDLSAAS